MSGPSCPRVTDTYTVDLGAVDAYQQARAAIDDLGMQIIRERAPCQRRGSDCRVSGQSEGRLVKVVIDAAARPATARATSHRAS